MRRSLVFLTLLLSILLGVTAPAAAGLPKCTGNYSQKVIYEGQGLLESIVVGGGGSLYVSGQVDVETSGLYGYSKGASRRTVATAGPGPGGLAWDRKRLLWGNGNAVANGQAGDTDPKSKLLSVRVGSGEYTTVSDRLGMANGVARARNGAIYATNDFGLKVDRIRNGNTKNGWASVESGNGIVVGKNQRYVYIAQTFVTPSRIAKVSVDDPRKTWTFFSNPDGTDVVLDGMSRDGNNNLYVAALSAGEVWKITPDKRACVIASGITGPSSTAISFARKGYRAGNLYVVGFGGQVVQVTGATRAGVPAG